MTKTLVTNHDFTHGELDKNLSARSDLDLYAKSAQELKNFCVMPGGGAKARFSTEMYDQLNFAFADFVFSSIFPFVFDGVEYLIGLFTTTDDQLNKQLFTFWYVIGQQSPVTLDITPNPAPVNFVQNFIDQDMKLKHVQLDNILYIVCSAGYITLTCSPAHPASSRFGVMINDYAFSTSPKPTQLFQNIAVATKVYDPHIGNTVFQISNATTDIGGLTDLTITTMGDFGGFTDLFVGGIFESLGPKEGDAIGRALIYQIASSTSVIIQILSPFRGFSNTSPTAQTLQGYNSYLSEQAYNDTRGFPAAIALYEDRLVIAGGPNQKNNIFYSSIGQYGNFTVGPNASDAINVTIATQESESIINMVAQRSLIVFTDENEYASPVWGVDTLSPSSVAMRRQTSVGSSNTTPIVFDNQVIFVKKGGKSMMTLNYGNGENSYTTNTASLTSNHLINNPVAMAAYTTNPVHDSNMLIVINGDGGLVLWESLAEENVSAWTSTEFISFKPTSGTLESRLNLKIANVVSIGDSVYFWLVPGSEDDGYLQIATPIILKLQWTNFNLDLYQEVQIDTTTIPSKSIINLTYFMPSFWGSQVVPVELIEAGATDTSLTDGVQFLGSFYVEYDQTLNISYIDVTDVNFSLSANSSIYVGNGFKTHLKTLPLHVFTQTGDSLFLKKRISKMYIKYINSYPFSANGQLVPTQATTVGTQTSEENLQADTLLSPEDGIFVAPILLGSTRNATIEIEQKTCLALTILGITLQVSR